MILTKRSLKIINLFLTGNKFTIDELADFFSITNRTVANNIKTIKNFLKSNNLNSLVENNGVYYIKNKDSSLISHLISKEIITVEERKEYIILKLLTDNLITLNPIAEELGITRRALNYDMIDIKEFFSKKNIELVPVAGNCRLPAHLLLRFPVQSGIQHGRRSSEGGGRLQAASLLSLCILCGKHHSGHGFCGSIPYGDGRSRLCHRDRAGGFFCAYGADADENGGQLPSGSFRDQDRPAHDEADFKAGHTERNSAEHHIPVQCYRPGEHQWLRSGRHGGLRRLQQGGWLRHAAATELLHGFDHLHRPEYRREKGKTCQGWDVSGNCHQPDLYGLYLGHPLFKCGQDSPHLLTG